MIKLQRDPEFKKKTDEETKDIKTQDDLQGFAEKAVQKSLDEVSQEYTKEQWQDENK